MLAHLHCAAFPSNFTFVVRQPSREKMTELGNRTGINSMNGPSKLTIVVLYSLAPRSFDSLHTNNTEMVTL